jgi:rod shape-determining protein MreC
MEPVLAVQAWISSRYLAVFEFLTVPRDVATLRQRNAELEDEISNLQKQNIELNQQLEEAQVLYALLDYARTTPENVYIASPIIGRDPSPFLQYVFIKHGSDDGIRHGMPVVTQQGLVGRVDSVIAGAAGIQLITSVDAVINVRLQNSGAEAQLTGSLTGDLSLQLIPQDVVVQPGELILTSGLGGNYPSDVLVGQVINVRKSPTELFQTATVQPAVDFINLRSLLVITNFRPVDTTLLLPSQ